MSTSAEQIAALIHSNTDLKLAFEGKRAEIDQTLNEVANRWEKETVIFYVDQAVGNDSNDGTKALPLASMQQAIDRTPMKTNCVIYFRGQYDMPAPLVGNGRIVHIHGRVDADWESPAANTLPNLVIGFGAVNNSDNVEFYGFSCRYGGEFNVARARILWPSQAEIAAAIPGAIYWTRVSAICAQLFEGYGSVGYVAFREVDMVLPADPAGTLLNHSTGYHLFLDQVVWSGSYAGLIHPLVTAGTANTAALPYVSTNLATL